MLCFSFVNMFMWGQFAEVSVKTSEKRSKVLDVTFPNPRKQKDVRFSDVLGYENATTGGNNVKKYTK